MIYNDTLLTNNTSPMDILVDSNNLMNGSLGLGIILVIGIVAFAIVKNKGYDSAVCFVVAGLSSATITLLFGLAQIVDLEFITIPIIITGISIFYALSNRN